MKLLSVLLIIASLFIISCGTDATKQTTTNKNSTDEKASATKVDTSSTPAAANKEALVPCMNDSLNELTCLIAGKNIQNNSKILNHFFSHKNFKSFSANFEKTWLSYDSSRLKQLLKFKDEEIKKNVGATKKLFYPFSGPDILYGYTFFPDADEYIMMGLEPVGTLPIYDEKKIIPDSMKPYYKKINTSLFAILNFSFFRTESMKEDLKNEELDGTLHLLFLFLVRTGNSICSAKPIIIDSSGRIQYIESFPKLQKKKALNKGIEITFSSLDKKTKKLYYYSLNLADGGLQYNKGMMKYLTQMGTINTYLKGASYLMHKPYFSMIRNIILNQSNYVVQDDSGIAFKYFAKHEKWNYTFYGKYKKPISLFSEAYQADLDSAYKASGSKDIGFGIGYNFKDKNSNFMIAKKLHIAPLE